MNILVFVITFLLCLIALGVVAGIFFILRERQKTRPSPKLYNSTLPQSSQPLANVPPTQPPAAAPSLIQLAAVAAPSTPEPTSNAKLYRRAQTNRAEGFFYDFLKGTVGKDYIIDIKTPISELFRIEGWLEKGLYAMYANGHIDFVLLEPTLKMPILAIELDGTTHNDPTQIERDQRKEELFRLSDMKLLRFRIGVVWGEKERAEILEALPKPLKS